MNSRTNIKPVYIELGGLPVRLSDVRGFELSSEKNRTVVLANGMKVQVSEDESKNLRSALNKQAMAIIRNDRAAGVL